MALRKWGAGPLARPPVSNAPRRPQFCAVLLSTPAWLLAGLALSCCGAGPKARPPVFNALPRPQMFGGRASGPAPYPGGAVSSLVCRLSSPQHPGSALRCLGAGPTARPPFFGGSVSASVTFRRLLGPRMFPETLVPGTPRSVEQPILTLL